MKTRSASDVLRGFIGPNPGCRTRPAREVQQALGVDKGTKHVRIRGGYVHLNWRDDLCDIEVVSE